MEPAELLSDGGWHKDAFRLIKAEEFEALGIDPDDIPLGTFPALRHPANLPSRFGGNAYGAGIFELLGRLDDKELEILQELSLEDPQEISKHHKKINRVYKKLGLLIRFTRFGKPYYLIPTHVLSNALLNVRAKLEEISKIIKFHRKKYFKERQTIGIVSHTDDILVQELALRFKEHQFVVLDSFDSFDGLELDLDLVILTRDIHEIFLLERFSPPAEKPLPRKIMDQYASFLLWKIYNVLRQEGEIFIISTHNISRTAQTAQIRFKTQEEEKNFLLFSHIFKTRKKYQRSVSGLEVNIFDFQKYLSGLYVEKEVLDRLLGGRDISQMSIEDFDTLPYLNFDLQQRPYSGEQEKTWSQLLSPFFNKIFLKPLLPKFIKEHWDERFSCEEYQPTYMLIYLGEKRSPDFDVAELKREVENSPLRGASFSFVAEYRNTFGYVIKTLELLNSLKTGAVDWHPRVLTERLLQPLQNKARRHPSMSHVLKLMGRLNKLKKIEKQLNPEGILGEETPVIENLEALSLLGFSGEELKEIVYIILGHTPMGRIISGKIHERSLKPLTDMVRTLDIANALNLLRYCRLMTMAELVASQKGNFKPEQFKELFDLYEASVRLVTTRELDWDSLMDEKTAAMGGARNQVIQKLLRMADLYHFLGIWSELPQKGEMEREALADYDPNKLAQIHKVIELLETIEEFEKAYLRALPLELASFYRKLLHVEFHGTGRLFPMLSSKSMFILLWITVNVLEGEIINFNPLLGDPGRQDLERAIAHLEHEVGMIKLQYLDLNYLRDLSVQLYQKQSTFIVGTGIQLMINTDSKALEVRHIDLDKGIKELDELIGRFSGHTLKDVSIQALKDLEKLFSSLESFYQSHLYLLEKNGGRVTLPARQRQWFNAIKNLRKRVRAHFLEIIFRPEDIHIHLSLLYEHAPTLLNFVLPEFTSLKEADLSAHVYMTSPVTDYILASARKLQALINKNKKAFHDIHYLHRLAKLEFGPLASGTVGISESQLQELERLTQRLLKNRPLFNALLRALVFQDIGRIQALREKYKGEIHPADLSEASALLIEKEEIAGKYGLTKSEEEDLCFLVRNHGLFHHIVRGEFCILALQRILETKDEEKFEAFFLFSLIILSAIREDLILEDLAEFLFELRGVCLQILKGNTTLSRYFDQLCLERGLIFYGLMDKEENVEEGTEEDKLVAAGRMILSTERLFRLHGIRYIMFGDISDLLLRKPIRYIYKKRNFTSVGYATFERELYEALRIYNSLQALSEPLRHFILEKLSGDRVRICGYEKVSGYLRHENQIKLLLLSLMGSKRLKFRSGPIYINFLPLASKVERRYEALNDYLNNLSLEEMWEHTRGVSTLFKARKGLIFDKASFGGVLSIDFGDKIDIEQKISYIETINNMDQLKNYYHYSLRSLRKYPFFTEDYERSLEAAYDRRIQVITKEILQRAKEHMELITNFQELDQLLQDLLERSFEIGLTEEQKHRLMDIYELRKEQLKKDKLFEINGFLGQIHDIEELKDYWETIKWYLQENRQFLGREFEHLVARRFDAAMKRLKEEHW